MGSVTWSYSGSVSKYGAYEAKIRVNYTENYSSSTNKTTVSLSSVDYYCNLSFGDSPVGGSVYFNNTTVKSFSGGYTNQASGGSWDEISNSSGSSVSVTHNVDGTASISIDISDMGASWDGRNFYVYDASAKTVSLTKHTSKLTVNPNEGTWNGNTSSQSFNQAPLSTKTINNPTRSGYIFNGWTLTGGGSLSGTTYTFSGSNGTLTANWILNSYTVTCEDRVGSTSGLLLGSSTASYNYNTTANGSDFGNNTTYNFYYTGYYYSTFTSSVITQNTTIYRIFLVNNYTLSIISSPTQGATISVNRTSSPNQMADIGSVTNGSLIYYGDVLSITYTVNSVYQLISATVNNVDISQEILPYNITVSENIVLSIVTKLGAIIYIGNEAYQAFIGDGVNWSQYQAYIGNGTSFDQY